MIAASARQLAGARNCFVGVGLPNIVATSPSAPSRRPAAGVRVGRLRRATRTAAAVDRRPDPRDGLDRGHVSMFELFAFYLQAGLIDVAFLGGAQIDRFGNINTTVIGDYDHPKVRLPGSGGAARSRSTPGRSW